jgi:hypothetical protein
MQWGRCLRSRAQCIAVYVCDCLRCRAQLEPLGLDVRAQQKQVGLGSGAEAIFIQQNDPATRVELEHDELML